MNAEEIRLQECRDRSHHWKRWGPYLSERAWGTVREDYSAYGTAWEWFPFDHSRSKAYRWNEDGLAGICDRHQQICFSIGLWNERDPFLKERLYGLTGNQGSHGEDVKECYFYLDSTPTHSYMKYLYKYPQARFPYEQLLEENRRRGKDQPEYELADTGVFNEDRYFDVFVEYAKGGVEDILVRITVENRGPEAAKLRVLPTIWFRNTWSWGRDNTKPTLNKGATLGAIELDHPTYPRRFLYCDGAPELLFTENETNARLHYGQADAKGYFKDGINDYVVNGSKGAVNPQQSGTKAAAHYALTVLAGGKVTIQLRLTDLVLADPFGPDFKQVFADRTREADEFYAEITPSDLSDDGRNVMRQALGGMLWSKQFYHYVVRDWLQGDPAFSAPAPERKRGRNSEWAHLYNADVISMPDKWEYPWYASWDLAFHCVALAIVDSDFAKEQLLLFLREWYMHPNGQIPAYEWAMGDVNPPVHAWAAYRVYQIEKKRRGVGDIEFLERVFHKLLLNFTWWVNRKDAEGMNIFQGGFLGLDNIGVFDRNTRLPNGGFLEQSDGTSWMAMYSLNLLAIALELARHDAAYEDVASKFWEHFVFIAHAMNHLGGNGTGLWDEEDGFYYDLLHMPDESHISLKVRSMVGLIPLFAVQTLEPELLERMPAFKRRLDWFVKNRADLTSNVACMRTRGEKERLLLSVVSPDRLRKVLRYMLDENEFLSPYGIRALSRYHRDHPYTIHFDGMTHSVDYQPGESTTSLFGGNSNWRGPIWFPVNFLLIESLQRFHHYLGDGFKVEYPTGSGQMLTLWEVAAELSRRLTRIFLKDESGRRPFNGKVEKFQTDPNWRDLILFNEYFHGDDGAGVGASHQTGWTGLVAKMLQQSGESKPQRAKTHRSRTAGVSR